MKKSLSVPLQGLHRILMLLILSLFLTSFARGQHVASFAASPPQITGDVPNMDVTDALALAAVIAADSLPGSSLFQLWGEEDFYAEDGQTPPALWPAPSGEASSWSFVYIAENLTDIFIVTIVSGGDPHLERFSIDDIPEDERPPVDLSTLAMVPTEFVNPTQALATSIDNGLSQYVELARQNSDYYASYTLSSFWFLYQDITTAESNPFWEIQIDYGNWNEQERRYEYTEAIGLVDAVTGTFLGLYVEEGFDEPDPFELVSRSPADGTTGLNPVSTISFGFNQSVFFPSFDYMQGQPGPFYSFFPKDSIAVDAVTLSEDQLTVSYEAIHTPDTDFLWILIAPGSSSGSLLTQPEVLHYSTAQTMASATVSGTLDLLNTPEGYYKTPGGGTETIFGFNKATLPVTQSDFGAEPYAQTIVALIAPPYNFDEFYGSINELNLRYATVADPVTGAYTIPHAADGEYYVGAVKYSTEFGFPYVKAAGFLERDGEPATISIEGGSLSDIDFTVRGYFPELVSRVDAQHAAGVAQVYQTTEMPDTRLLALGTFEYKPYDPYLKSGTDSPATSAEFPAGTAEDWWFAYFDETAETMHMLTVFDDRVTGHDIMPVADIPAEDLPPVPVGELRTIPQTYINSTDAIQAIRNHGLDDFLATLPADASMEVEYEMGDLWSEYPEHTSAETGHFWVIDIYAFWWKEFGDDIVNYDYYGQYLVHAETGEVITEIVETSTNELQELPQTASLDQNYPNPFNPHTQIRFNLPASGEVSLNVFDVTGRRIATLVDAQLPAGTHTVRLDGNGLSSGVYIYQLVTQERSLSRKMTLIK
ncbi:MAG: extracellular protein [Bacteroidetes bacterium HLUCCA01]|nr:MAG: extracellular protein [Bacteroidetes bacterium HLUCCA01]